MIQTTIQKAKIIYGIAMFGFIHDLTLGSNIILNYIQIFVIATGMCYYLTQEQW